MRTLIFEKLFVRGVTQQGGGAPQGEGLQAEAKGSCHLHQLVRQQLQAAGRRGIQALLAWPPTCTQHRSEGLLPHFETLQSTSGWGSSGQAYAAAGGELPRGMQDTASWDWEAEPVRTGAQKAVHSWGVYRVEGVCAPMRAGSGGKSPAGAAPILHMEVTELTACTA